MSYKIHKFTSPVIGIEEQESAYDALRLMRKNLIKRIVITRGNAAVGIVTESDISKFLEGTNCSSPLGKVKVSDVMSKNLVKIKTGNPNHLYECSMMMDYFDVGSVIVEDHHGQVVGITTKFDFVINYPNFYQGMYKVDDYMTRRLFTCRNQDSITYALHLLSTNKIKRLIVTDHKGKPTGIITYQTFLQNSEFLTSGESSEKISVTASVGGISRGYLLSQSQAENTVVSDFVDSALLTVGKQEDLAKAASIMSEYKISGIPVVNDSGMLEGVISTSDIAKIFSEEVPRDLGRTENVPAS